MKIIILTLSAAILLAGCKSKKKLAEEQATKEEINETVDSMLVDIENLMDEPEDVPQRPRYNPSEKRINDVIHTHLQVAFDWKNHYLYGKATIELKPYFYPTDSLQLDAKGMDIHRVSLINNKAFKDLKYKYDGMFLNIALDKEYTRNDKYKIYIEYTAKPDEFEMGGSSAIAGDKGLYFINSDSSEVGKPTQIWTQGETEASSRWFPTIDAPNEKMTQEIEITVRKEFKTLSNGLLLYSTDNGDGTRTDHWKQSLPHTPYLAMMAVGDFAVVKDSWTRENGKKMLVDYYVEKEYEPHAKDIFGATPDMIEYFSNLLGVEYPWEKYSQVVVRDYVSGAMENTSATIHGEFLHRTKRELIDEHNESIIAHELFHHWFGDLVTCESWANLPLNESFANYSQYLWDEYRHGQDEADYNAENEMMGYIYSAQQSGHVDMIRYGYGDKEEMFDGHSYNKGGRILHMLRTYLGDDAFFGALNLYLTQNKFQPAEIHHLRLAFEEICGEDLNWFFNQWFLDNGHPVLHFTTEVDSVNNRIAIYTEQRQDLEDFPVYKLPIDVDVYYSSNSVQPGKDEGAKSERTRIWVDAVYDTAYIKINEYMPIRLINIDAQHILLAEIDYDLSLEERVFQFYNAPRYADRNESLLYCRRKRDEMAVQLVIDAMSDPFWKIRETAARNLRRAVRAQKDVVKAKLIDLAKNDPNSTVRATAVSELQDHFSGDDALAGVYEQAIKDSSYYVMGVGLQALFKEDADRGYQVAKTLEKENSSSLKTAIGDVYADKGNPEDLDFYASNWTVVGGFEKISFLKTFGRFLKKQDDELVFKGLEVFEEVAKNAGTMWVKYFGGYQTILDFQSHYYEEMQDAEKRIKELKANEGSSSDIQLAERELADAAENMNKTNEILERLREQETDEQILMFLDGGARMEILDDEE